MCIRCSVLESLNQHFYVSFNSVNIKNIFFYLLGGQAGVPQDLPPNQRNILLRFFNILFYVSCAIGDAIRINQKTKDLRSNYF